MTEKVTSLIHIVKKYTTNILEIMALGKSTPSTKLYQMSEEDRLVKNGRSRQNVGQVVTLRNVHSKFSALRTISKTVHREKKDDEQIWTHLRRNSFQTITVILYVKWVILIQHLNNHRVMPMNSERSIFFHLVWLQKSKNIGIVLFSQKSMLFKIIFTEEGTKFYLAQ